MKFNKSQAARAVGINRKTLDKHIKTKGISVDFDDNGNPLIDASELIRVYGDKFRPDGDTQKTPEQGTSKTTPVPTLEAAVEIAELKKDIEHLKAQRDHFEELFNAERSERQAGQNLLTDQREKQDAWEKSFEELRQQIAEQDRTAKQELNEHKEETEKLIQRYRKALIVERNKSLWEKAFPKKKKMKQGGQGA